MKTASLAPMECPATAEQMLESRNQNRRRAAQLARSSLCRACDSAAGPSQRMFVGFEACGRSEARGQRPGTDHGAIRVPEAVCGGARLESGREALSSLSRRRPATATVKTASGRCGGVASLRQRSARRSPTPGRAARQTGHRRAASIPGSKTVTVRRTLRRKYSTWRS